MLLAYNSIIFSFFASVFSLLRRHRWPTNFFAMKKTKQSRLLSRRRVYCLVHKTQVLSVDSITFTHHFLSHFTSLRTHHWPTWAFLGSRKLSRIFSRMHKKLYNAKKNWSHLSQFHHFNHHFLRCSLQLFSPRFRRKGRNSKVAFGLKNLFYFLSFFHIWYRLTCNPIANTFNKKQTGFDIVKMVFTLPLSNRTHARQLDLNFCQFLRI